MNRSVKLVCLFLLSFYALQLFGIATDIRIKDDNIRIITSSLILYQVIFILLFYIIYRKKRQEQTQYFIINTKIKVVFFLLFITVEIMAIILFAKEGIPIFDADPGGAKLKIADGNGIYIRYIKYFGNIVTFTLLLLLNKQKLKQKIIAIIYFLTIALFGYRSELVLLFLQYYIIMSIVNEGGNKYKFLNKIFIFIFMGGVIGSLFYFSLGQDGAVNNSTENIDRIINRLTIEQVESVPYIISESLEYDLFPTPELGKEINAIFNRILGEKDQNLFYGERLHKKIFGDMGANFLSVTTYGAELLAFFGPLCIFLIPIGLCIPFAMLKKISNTHSTVNGAIYSFLIMILLQYLIAGNASAFFFGPFITAIVMSIPLMILHDILKR
ncbi:O-antigen polymerase [Salmonella enterica]|nr:O-antigen polymerase [Salmonella enterica]EDQ3283736.1 oligosaccharide repeat unit polymerase [Salmonella enterica subsp. enterica serovar Urbana]ESF12958.1 O antigen polymerase [Salmonella enterica subsp. enterica serovar Urbana str. ATCC 9261]